MREVQELYTLFMDELHRRSFTQKPKELYAPIDYIMQLGGKRLRPILLLMTYELFKNNVRSALPAAFAIEVFHNFSLVHDDIMDEARLRRGKPTVHQRYGVNTGILSGDVMLIYAYKSLMELENSPNISEILHTFNRVAIEVCEGQQMDMNFEQRADVQLEEYLQMITFKTAVLLAGAMKIGALIAEASAEDAQHAYAFGKKMGVAFQLQDDLLDTFGDPSKFGKKIGGDILQNKKTFLVLKSLEIADASTKDNLLRLLHTNNIDENVKIEAVKKVFVQLDIPQYTNVLKQQYQAEAMQHLAQIQVPDQRKRTLKNLARQMLGREV